MTDEDLPFIEPAARLVPIEAITVPERLRPIDEHYVDMLAASIEDIGLSTPIVVRSDEEADERFVLVAGAHRFAAVTKLDHKSIAAVVYLDMDDDSARLVEIDENLMRRELHALDRCIFLLERKVVYERLNPTAKHGAAPKRKSGQVGHSSANEKSDGQVGHLLLPRRFTAEAADATGFSERSIRRDIEIASKLDKSTVEIIRGTKFAGNQRTLIELAQMERVQQRAAASELQEGRAKTITAARHAAEGTRVEVVSLQQTYLSKIDKYWTKAEPYIKIEFLRSLKNDAAVLMFVDEMLKEHIEKTSLKSKGA